MTRVAIEKGSKRVFAVVVDWPGWASSGKDEAAALAALEACASRYAAVARKAGLQAPGTGFEVIERVAGNATTDFGAPAIPLQADRAPLDAAERKRLRRLLEAAWSYFDEVVAGAPAELRKGPRGGGRDRDKIVAHVDDAEAAYQRAIGLKARGRDAVRAAIAEAVGSGADEGKWPLRYAVRRVAWHVIFHAWEIEDRST